MKTYEAFRTKWRPDSVRKMDLLVERGQESDEPRRKSIGAEEGRGCSRNGKGRAAQGENPSRLLSSALVLLCDLGQVTCLH